MASFHINTGVHMSRRRFLRGAGIAMGLPMLDSMTPAFAASAARSPKRFVGITLALGLHAPNWVPRGAGFNYEPSPYLTPYQDLRKDFTVISGTSLPGVTGGHIAESSVFTACPNARGATSRNTISLDQLMAKHLGHETRFPSLVLSTQRSNGPSYTENGAMIPAMDNPKELFAQLFVQDTPEARKKQAELLESGRSVMDVISEEAKSIHKEVGAGDRDKLEEWFTSVRDLEKRLQMNEKWIDRPKPKVGDRPKPAQKDNATDVKRLMLDIMVMALKTDSTRFITLQCRGDNVRALEGVETGYHNLSHHGRDEEKLDQLATVERAMIESWANFLRELKNHKQDGRTLLDDTMVFLTSNLGNASSHDNRNVPALFAGGDFKHGQHIAFDQKNNYPLSNLYLNMLHNVGLMHENFATSTGTMKGIQAKS